MSPSQHVHHFRPRSTGERYSYTDWVDGKPVHKSEPINEMRCDCGLTTKQVFERAEEQGR